MPQIGLRGMKVAKYNNTNGTITYGAPMSAGGAMTANLELRFAEGRLYADDALAEYIRRAIGGTISIGVKYIPNDAQKLMFGVTEKSRTVGSATVKSLQTSKQSKGEEVGVAFFGEDVIDGVSKVTCVFVPRARFGEPSMTLQTMGETINFATPTTSGEFLADHSAEGVIKDVVTVADEAAAEAWINACFGAN